VLGDVGQARDQALEGMRVGVDHAGQDGAGEALVVAVGRDIGFDPGDMAVLIERDAHVPRPAVGEQRARGVQAPWMRRVSRWHGIYVTIDTQSRQPTAAIPGIPTHGKGQRDDPIRVRQQAFRRW